MTDDRDHGHRGEGSQTSSSLSRVTVVQQHARLLRIANPPS